MPDDVVEDPLGRTIAALLARSSEDGSLDETLHFFTRDFVLHMPIVTVPRGPRAWTSAYRFFTSAFMPLSVTSCCGVASDAAYATRLEIAGKHTRPLGQLRATGREFSTTALSVWRFRGPLIAEASIELNALGLALDLGLAELVSTLRPVMT